MNSWTTWIVNGLPMLLLVAVWIFFMIGMGKWKKFGWVRYQEKHLELLEQQLVVLRQTNELLKRLVEAK